MALVHCTQNAGSIFISARCDGANKDSAAENHWSEGYGEHTLVETPQGTYAMGGEGEVEDKVLKLDCPGARRPGPKLSMESNETEIGRTKTITCDNSYPRIFCNLQLNIKVSQIFNVFGRNIHFKEWLLKGS